MGRKRSEPPEEMKKFLAIKLLEHLASNLVYSWDNIKPPMQLGERNPIVEQGMAKGKVVVVKVDNKVLFHIHEKGGSSKQQIITEICKKLFWMQVQPWGV